MMGAREQVVNYLRDIQGHGEFSSRTAAEIAETIGVKLSSVSATLVERQLPYIPVSYVPMSSPRRYFYEDKEVLPRPKGKPGRPRSKSGRKPTERKPRKPKQVIADGDIAKVIHRDGDGTIVLITGSGQLIKGRVMT